MKVRSDWMEGLLWAEEYIERGSFFEDDTTGIKTLNWALYYSGEYSDEETINVEWFKGA